MEYYSVAEMFWPKNLHPYPDIRKHVCLVYTTTTVTSSRFQQFFREKENCDAKMIISNNCESYHNHNICLNNMILPYRAVLVRSNELSASQEVKKIPVAQN